MNLPLNHHDLCYPFLDLKKQLPADLTAINHYYEVVIDVLRSKLPGRIDLTDHDRGRIATAALEVKNHIGQPFFDLKHIVSPETILRWYRRLKAAASTYNTTSRKPGRPPTPEDAVKIILKIAHETSWGYERIAGEMKKLGHDICSNSVKAILVKNGVPPHGLRKGTSWKTFILAHLDVTWACDFFTEQVLTPTGFMTCYVLFFIHLGTRKIHFAGTTHTPDAAWVGRQARNFSMILDENPKQPCRFLIHDNDNSFVALDAVLKADSIEIKKTAFKSPWQNGYAERFVREAREVLDNMIIFGRPHLDHVLKKVQRHHNEQRPHQGIGNIVPLGFDCSQKADALGDIRCEETLGGLLRHYYVRKAA